MSRTRINATIHVVTRHNYVKGPREERHDIPSVELPHRIGKRLNVAHGIGLTYVRALGAGGDVLAVTVSDGKRALASWRRMTSLPGFTGTHDVHPLVSDILKGESVGAWLNRRMERSW